MTRKYTTKNPRYSKSRRISEDLWGKDDVYNLKMTMRRNNVSHSEIAQLFDVTRQTINKWLNGGAISERHAKKVREWIKNMNE